MFENIIVAMSSMSPLSMTAAASYAECQINGQIVACDQLPAWFGYMMTIFPLSIFIAVGLVIVSSWFIFQKAGKPGWASLIPIYNVVNMMEIIGKPTWWVLLMFIPFVNIIIALIVLFKIVKVFGKGFGFGLGALFLPFIFLPILAFGKSVYTRPEGSPVGGVSFNSNNIQPAPVPSAPIPEITSAPIINQTPTPTEIPTSPAVNVNVNQGSVTSTPTDVNSN